MAEKLFLTSLLGFIDATYQCGAGMLVVGLYLIVLFIASPYVRRIDDRLCGLSQSYLLLILLIGLVLQQQDVFVPDSFEDIAASVIMLGVVTALAVLIVIHLLIFVRKFIRNRQRATALKDAKTIDSMVLNPLMLGGGGGGGGTGTTTTTTGGTAGPHGGGGGIETSLHSGTTGSNNTHHSSGEKPDLSHLSADERGLAEMMGAGSAGGSSSATISGGMSSARDRRMSEQQQQQQPRASVSNTSVSAQSSALSPIQTTAIEMGIWRIRYETDLMVCARELDRTGSDRFVVIDGKSRVLLTCTARLVFAGRRVQEWRITTGRRTTPSGFES